MIESAGIEGVIRPVAAAERASSNKNLVPTRPAVTICRGTFSTLASSISQPDGIIPSQLRIIIRRVRAADDDADRPEEKESLQREMNAVASRDGNLKREVVQMDRSFMDAAGFHMGDRVRIEVNRLPEADAHTVVLKRLLLEDGEATGLERDEGEGDFVPKAAEWFVRLSTFIYTGVSLTVNVPYLQPKPRYKVISVNGTRHILAKITPSTKIVVNDQEEEEAEVNLQLQSIPGFSAQVKQINIFLTSLKYGLFPGNLVINGGRGSGKSFFLDAIANMQWHAVHRVDQTCTFSKIQDVLDGAKKTRQSALIIDDLDLILQNFKSQPSTLRVLMALLDKTLNVTAYEPMQKESHWPKLIIIASCADCFALPEQFQDRNRFAKAITLPVPDAEQRLEILQSLLASDASDGILRDVASRTYAYTPRDLGRLYDQVNIARADRLQDSGVSKFDPDHHRVEKQDVEHALSTSKPSGLRDINLRPPTVRWDDIGGQERIKAQLRAMVESIKNPRPKVNRGKAALFYGPPGCAKTLFAQAMATEAGCNFFSVKGPELVSKYVGETERSLRALFTRARAYAPSIIFFDEIDSMGFRAEGGPSAASLRGAFLTEMDGFEHRGGVFVIAATNRPWDVDPALQRAGRFSFKVYMGLPDEPSRVAIARILARKLEVDQAELDYDKVARMTEGYSGADLEDMLVTEYEESGTLTMEGISEATACTEPSVSRDTLARFEEWEASKKKPQH